MDDDLISGDPADGSLILPALEQARDLARSLPDEQLELQALFFSTYSIRPDADLERLLPLVEEGIALAQRVNRWWLAELLLAASMLTHWAGQHERAAALGFDACALADELGNERVSITARLTLSFTTPGTSRAGTAPMLADIVKRAEELGDKRLLAWLYPAVGSEAFSARRLGDAARWYRVSIELGRDSGYWHAGAFGLVGAQAVAYQRGRLEAAARLQGALAPHVAALRRAAPPRSFRAWQAVVAALRQTLGEETFEAAAGDGAELSWDAALDEAFAICQGESDERREPPRKRSRPHQPWELELTDRELEVLRLIAGGGTNKDVAAALGIRAKTVMHHSMAIYRKLGVRGRAEATAYAFRNNLIDAARPT
jgi:DNA-binding CsgD family transcriptional regulator